MRKLITKTSAWSLFAWLLLFSTGLFAQNCPSGTIGGHIFQDFNFNGIADEAATTGLPGIQVLLYKPLMGGGSAPDGTTTTDALGNWQFTSKTDGVKYRVEFILPPALAGLQTTFFGSENSTTVQFVTAPDCSVGAAFAAPADYCQNAPLVGTACYVSGDPLAGGSAGSVQALLSFVEPGPAMGANTLLANASSVGSCWGISYQRETKTVFAAANLRRHSGFGPGGTGAIYAYDFSNPMAPASLGWLNFDSLGIETGLDPRIASPLPADKAMPSHDVMAFDSIGKMSFGDIDISEDGRYLWVMNLHDRTLYRVFIDQPFVKPSLADITAFPLTNPGCGNDNDWRPWAVKVHRGEVYVGIVCTAESNAAGGLHAFVKKLNGGGTFDPVFDYPLDDFTRGWTFFQNPAMNTWQRWKNSADYLSMLFQNFRFEYPQPVLSDIEFDIDGSMLLGYLDRTGHQGGYQNYPPDVPSNNATFVVDAGGDLNRICNDNGTFKLEGDMACQNAGGTGNMQGPGGDEYYWDDTWPAITGNPGNANDPNAVIHGEVFVGGLALIPGKGEVISTCYDPLNAANTGGALWMNNLTGGRTRGYEVFPAGLGFAGKSNGLGDLESFCDPAPIEKGNFVWEDVNADGIQDPNEPPISGVNVSLYDSIQCQHIATVQTNADGEYYFNETTVGQALQTNHTYYIVIGEMGQFSGGVLNGSLSLTTANTGTGPNLNLNDSDGEIAPPNLCFDSLPYVKFHTGGPGSVDHTCDFGFFRHPCDLEFLVGATIHETCFGAADGYIGVYVTQFGQVIEYAINTPTNWQLGGIFLGLGAGTFKFYAREQANPTCIDSLEVTLPPGIIVDEPTNVVGYQICQGGVVPPGQGLTAFCDPQSCAAQNGGFGGLNWYDAPTGGNLVGTGPLFNPVAGGFINPNVPGMTSFWAECWCYSCVSPRVEAVFTVYPTPVVLNVGHIEICQFENLPANTGLTATCSPCPQGLAGNLTWWNAPTGGQQVGSGSPFNPISAGLVNNAIPGLTTFYAQCECGPCLSARLPVTFRIWPLPEPVISGNEFPCPDSDETYTTPFHAGSNWMWSLDGGGSIVSQNQNSIVIHWNNVSGGPHTITVKETDLHGCMKTVDFQAIVRPVTVSCAVNLNISLNEMCMAQITPDLVLTGQYPTYSGYTLMVTDLAGNMVPNAKVTGKGDWKFKITEPCNGNSCWGNFKTEDKMPPQLVCLDVHVPCSQTVVDPVIPDLSGMTATVVIGGVGGVTITDNCAVVDITFSDVLVDFDCIQDPATSFKINRTWVATDMTGNHSTCVQMLFFDRKMLGDVQFPNDYMTYNCASGTADPSITGVPTIGGIGIWPTSGYCEINVAFTDQVTEVCDGTTKILRTWTAYDWCKPTGPDNPRIKIQVIKLIDNAGPIIDCPPNKEISTDPSACTATYNLPDVLVTDNCSRIKSVVAKYTLSNWQTVTVVGYIDNFVGNNPWNPDTMAVLPVIFDIPPGIHVITYIVEDDCGNTSTCEFHLTVIDGIPPVNVCTEITQIALGSDGLAIVAANSFDAGSYDNCSPVRFKVRRMDASTCVPNNAPFSDFARFCCSDVGDTVNIILRAYDQPVWPGDVSADYLEGHFDDCMVQAYVEDKLKPVCTPPDAVTVACEAFDPSLWAYGKATASDNCALDTITESVNNNQFDAACKDGIIFRTWTVRDKAGNTSRCTQKITVVPNTDFWVKFPDDQNLSNCNATGDYGMPVITGENCELIAIHPDDQIFTLVPDACYKILRTWTIINWCDFDPNGSPLQIDNPSNSLLGPSVHGDNMNHGHFIYTQIIKIQDVVKPMAICPLGPVIFEDFTSNDPNLFADIHHDLCEGPAALGVTATDLCSKSNLDFFYILKLDLDGDGFMETVWNSGTIGSPGIDIQKDSTTASAMIVGLNLPYGKHLVKWIVTDGCGNEAVCEYEFTVRDGKKPTVTCLNGLSVNIMQTKMITLWASDFLLYAEDNCTPVFDLEYGIRKAGSGTGFPTDKQVTFDCTELGTNSVELWAKDAAGNADFCATYVIVQDNAGACQTTAQVSGSIQTKNLEGVENVEVKITGQQTGLPAPSIFTGLNGSYDFTAIPIGDDYKIQPLKNLNPLNGVSTFDLVFMSKHILGVKKFDSPYQWIAADINKNGQVTTFDIVELRKVILGVNANFPQNQSWRFVDKNHVFDMAGNPLATAFPEIVELADFQSAATNGNFVACKIGDLNGDAIPNNLVFADDRNPVGTLTFDLREQEFHAGDVVDVAFTANDMVRVLAWQTTLAFDREVLRFVELKTGSLPGLSADNFGLQQAENGLITTSWNGELDSTVPMDAAFTLRFVALSGGKLSELLHLSNEITPASGWNKNTEELKLELRFSGPDGQQTTTGTGFELFQNVPNPFDEQTTIGFHLPENSDCFLRIFDATGKLMLTEKRTFEKGIRSITIDRQRLPTSGLFYYELTTATEQATRKMVIGN